ncbi:MAG: hypothetical protein ACRDPF_07955 [Streptosporangiaceae bacterium]
MSKIVAGITMSVDGYITGPDDGPGQGLGVGGERLHYWVFGGPWDYESSGQGEASGEDKAYLDEMTGANGAVIAGRGTYEAAGAWAAPTRGAFRCSSSPTGPASSQTAAGSPSPAASPRRSSRPAPRPGTSR